jgi:type II secretory pathway pseudopilin PulG
MRSGFGLITAIIIMVLTATIGTMILSVASMTSKKAMDDHLRLQAELLAKSATEFALLRISGYSRSGGNCLQNVDISAYPYDINVTIWYMFSTDPGAGCTNKLSVTAEPNANGTAIIDTVVTLDSASGMVTEPITVHRRTLQKP